MATSVTALRTTATAIILALALGGCQGSQMGYATLARDAAAMPDHAPPGTPGNSGTPAITPTPGAGPDAIRRADATALAERVNRVVIYSAVLGLAVPDLSAALRAVQAAAEAAGGYLQELDGASITVRVPAERFSAALVAIEKLGQVTGRQIKSQDVTEEMRDLASRLENAEKTRDTLTKLMDKSQKMDDTLAMARELERVTESVELLKGRIRYLQSQGAFSTLKVTLALPQPEPPPREMIPFPWVWRLGDGLLTGATQSQPQKGTWGHHGVSFDLPADYICHYERDQLTEAMSAQDVIVRVQRQDNYRGGNTKFWSTLSRRVLTEHRGLVIAKESELTPAADKGSGGSGGSGGAGGRMIVGGRGVAAQPRGYLLMVVASKDYVYTFEAWGPKEAFDKDLPELEKSAATLEVGS